MTKAKRFVQLITSDAYLCDSILKEYQGIIKENQYGVHELSSVKVFTFSNLDLHFLKNSRHLFEEDLVNSTSTILYIRIE